MKLIAKFTRTRTSTKTVAWKYKSNPSGGTTFASGYYARLNYDKNEITKEIAFNFDGRIKDINAGTLERIVDKCSELSDRSHATRKDEPTLITSNPIKLLSSKQYAPCKY